MNQKSDFKPSWWLRNPHFQTLWPVLANKFINYNLQFIRERYETEDGDFIDLDWLETKSNGPIILILHGLEGSIDSHYAQSVLATIRNKNWRGVFVNFRGCSGEPNRLARGYHSGDTKDLQDVLSHIVNRFPNVLIAAVGYSLGANVLLKYLGEKKHQSLIKLAVAVSVPFDLQRVTLKIQKGFAKIYQRHFLNSLYRSFRDKIALRGQILDVTHMKKIKTVFDFDDSFTAPLHGFENAEHYYNSSSCKSFLKEITVSTLIVHAKDDPFMDSDVIPQADELSDQIDLYVTEFGGHVGFIDGNFPWTPTWLNTRISSFLEKNLTV